MQKAVVFDLDGTLMNTLEDIAASMNQALAKHGLPPHACEAYKRFTGNGARVLTRRAVGDRAELYDCVFADYAAHYAKNSRVKSTPYPGVMDMLKALAAQGYALCVYSNKDDADVQEVVNYYFAGIAFTAVQGNRPNMPLKPDPAAVLSIAARLGVAPQAMWYVGDTLTDMACAKAAGMRSIAVGWGFEQRENLQKAAPDYLVDEPRQVVEILTAAALALR